MCSSPHKNYTTFQGHFINNSIGVQFTICVLSAVCVDDDSNCSGCESCDSGDCVDDDSNCNAANCEVCIGGVCKDCLQRYGTCCKCENSSCVSCKCWDTGVGISGSINVQNAKLCEQKTHTSSITDKDHWVSGCPTPTEGTPADSLVYSWSKAAGSGPSGTFIGDTNQPSVVWQAPPCTGTVTITLDVNDKSDPMDNPCPGPGNTRDDSPINKSDTATVSLPTGCEYAGAHDSSVHWINPSDAYLSATVPPFGDFTAYPVTYEDDFKYDSCKWVCEISDVNAETRIRVRDPNSLAGMVSVSQASDIPCVDANLAKYDLDDTDLTDDIGAPRTKYWCYNATVAHEEKHRSDWKTFYGDELAIAIACCELCRSDIDCSDLNTITCQAAENKWKPWIQTYFTIAAEEAAAAYDDPNTPIDEEEVRAYLVNYGIEQPIPAALPGGCKP